MKTVQAAGRPLYLHQTDSRFVSLMPLQRICGACVIATAVNAADAVNTADNAAPATDSTTTPHHLCVQDDGAMQQQFAQWQQQGLPIGDIRIEQRPIFDENDPDENNWLFRLINQLHINTQPKVIQDDLLFKTGEPFDATKVSESERLLRRRSYLREPTILPVGECVDNVDLVVSSREVWTLIPQVGYSHKGGESNSMFGIKDKNIFGSGRELSVQYEKNSDYTRRYVGYRDPSWGNLRGIFSVQYGQTDEGDYHNFNLERPFYALETPWAAGISSSRIIQTGKTYFRSESVQEFEQETEEVKLYYGLSDGLVNNRVSRLSLGLAQQQTLFHATEETLPEPAVPADRRYTYPFISWEFINTDYVKARNVNQINITEDYNRGWQWRATLGFSSDALGDSERARLFNVDVQKTFLWDDDKLFYAKTAISGVYHDHDYINTIVDGLFRYHQGDEDSQLYVGSRLRYGHGLTVDEWLYIGGDNGLRGYPFRYQVGDRSALMSVEWRWFTNYEFLHLADVGFAAFYDVGRAWFEDRDNGEYGGWLRNAGFGVRLAPTRIGGEIRSGDSTVIHIDVAFPLDARDDVGSVQWLLQAKQSF